MKNIILSKFTSDTKNQWCDECNNVKDSHQQIFGIEIVGDIAIKMCKNHINQMIKILKNMVSEDSLFAEG